MVCTEIYERRFKKREAPGKGLGATWEGAVITQELYESQGRNEKFIPVVFCQDDLPHRPIILRGGTYYDLSSEEEYQKLYRHLTKQPGTPMPPLGPITPMPPLPRKTAFVPRWNVPVAHNPFFTGRQKEMEDLRAVLASGGRAALTGMGGVGKTQVATEYAHFHRNEYQAVLWVRAASPDVLISDFVALATLLDLAQKEEREEKLVVAAVRRWLENETRWLLILDNAEDLGLIPQFVPVAAKGHVLLTTQGDATGGFAQAIKIEDLSTEQAALLLLRRAKVIQPEAPLETAAPADRSSAQAIAVELGGLPLALDQAGAYIEETACGLSAYLGLYRQRASDLLKYRGAAPTEHADSVATTFTLSFEKIEKANPAAAELLRFCAFLHPDAIPEEIIMEGGSELGPILQPVAADPFQFNAVILAILKYSLLRRDPNSRTFAIHRLAQKVLQDGMDEASRRRWAERTVKAVNCTFPSVEFPDWPKCERLVAQVQASADLIEREGIESPEAARLLDDTGLYLLLRARFDPAGPLLERALAIREKALGLDHPDVAACLNNLAQLYHLRGKYADAGRLYNRALAMVEKALGLDHPDVATCLNNLAQVYHAQGKYAEAEPLFRRALAIWEKALDPDVAACLNNLAQLYYDQGKYTEAEPLIKRALAIRETALGPDHPDVATCLNNLAQLYYDQGKYAEGEPLCKRALAIWEKALGPDHPDVATCLNNLAGLYDSQGKYAEAEHFLKRALSIHEKALGPEHPAVGTDLSNLAGLYSAQGKDAEAEPLIKRAFAIEETALGPVHPYVATCLEYYAVLLRKTNRNSAAVKMETRARWIRKNLKTSNPG